MKWFKKGWVKVKQFVSMHPYQFGMVCFMVVIMSGNFGYGVYQSKLNDKMLSEVTSSQKISLSDLGKKIDSGEVVEIKRHELNTGSVVAPKMKGYMEIFTEESSEKGAFYVEENKSSQSEIWKLIVNKAFEKKFEITNGFNQPDKNIVRSVIEMMLFFSLIILVIVFAQQMLGEVLSGKTFKVKDMNKDLKMNDVIGNDEVKEMLLEVVDQLKYANEYGKYSVTAPKGVLLTGDPGVGKTMLANALANELGADLFFATGADFAEMYVGVGPKRVAALFKNARMSKIALIFIDEIDAIGNRESMGNDTERRAVINALLSEMDGLENNGRLIVVGATNHIENLDKALRRRGRFDRIVHVPLPSKKDRAAILSKYVGEAGKNSDVDLEAMALRTMGYSGANLKGIADEAKNLALRRMGGRVAKDNLVITMKDLMEAQEIIIMGMSGKSAEGETLKRVAYHELGHALAGYLMCPKAYVEKVSVIGRGGSLGHTSFRPIEESLLVTKNEYLAQISLILSGYATEKVIFEDVSDGAADDLDKATKMAERMVVRLGMGYKSGLISGTMKNGELSEDQREDIKNILNYCLDKAVDMVRENRGWFDVMATRLIEKKLIGNEELFSDFI